jgi:hypothetical protein
MKSKAFRLEEMVSKGERKGIKQAKMGRIRQVKENHAFFLNNFQLKASHFLLYVWHSHFSKETKA